MRFQRITAIVRHPTWWREYEPWSDGRPDSGGACRHSTRSNGQRRRWIDGMSPEEIERVRKALEELGWEIP